MKFTKEQLEKIQELTDGNEHELALWYGAACVGSPLADTLARHVCEYLIAGELTPDLHERSYTLRRVMLQLMKPEDREAFRSVT